MMQQMLDQELAEQTPEDLAARRQPYEFWERNFGDKVRQWRRKRNWSQDELAQRLRRHGFDMHQTTVAKIERGSRPLRVAEAAAIATIFRVPPLAVFMGPPPEQQPWSLQQMHETLTTAEKALEETKEMMETSAKFYIEQQATVFQLANMINEAALRAEKRINNDDAKAESGDTEA